MVCTTGENFRFQEGIAAPGPLSALMGSLLTLVVVTMLAIPIFHILLRLVVNKPGQGGPGCRLFLASLGPDYKGPACISSPSGCTGPTWHPFPC